MTREGYMLQTVWREAPRTLGAVEYDALSRVGWRWVSVEVDGPNGKPLHNLGDLTIGRHDAPPEGTHEAPLGSGVTLSQVTHPNDEWRGHDA